MNKKIEVFEVGPRDGFQSVKCTPPIATDLKLEVIDRIVAAGVRHMEYTSFVSPKAIPQMQDAVEVTRYLLERHPEVDLFALVPNFHGAKSAVECGLKTVSPVISLIISRPRIATAYSFEKSTRISGVNGFGICRFSLARFAARAI